MSRDADGTPIELDRHRGMEAQKETLQRRRTADVRADQAELRARQAEIEHEMMAGPAPDWPAAASKARYLLELFRLESAGQDDRRRRLIEAVLADFERLSSR
jgi:hypothetical protein